MKSIVLTLILVVFSINVSLNAQDMKSFEDDDASLEYPSSWEVIDIDKKKKENPDNPMINNMILEITADKDDEASKSVKAIKMDMMGKNPSLADIEGFFVNMYSSQDKVQILKKSKGTVNGYDYRSMTVKSNADGVDKIGVQRFFLKGRYIYLVSTSSQLAEFPNFKSTSSKVLDSFKVD